MAKACFVTKSLGSFDGFQYQVVHDAAYWSSCCRRFNDCLLLFYPFDILFVSLCYPLPLIDLCMLIGSDIHEVNLVSNFCPRIVGILQY